MHARIHTSRSTRTAAQVTAAPFDPVRPTCARGSRGGPVSAPATVQEVLCSPGRPLDASTRAFFEPRFGHAFGNVRVHADGKAGESARAVNASAYAVGSDVVFAPGMYAPQTPAGRELLAHELAHTLQQTSGSGAGGIHDRLVLGDPGDAAEREADAAAGRVGSGKRSSALTPAAGGVVRRKATFVAGNPRDERNAAELIITGGPAGVTVPMLNGKMIRNSADAQSAVAEPGIESTPKKGGGVQCSIKTVPENTGSYDESVLSSGPWVFQTPKAAVPGYLGWTQCRGAGNTTVTAHGKPRDIDVAKANRTHEDHHATDDEKAFNDTLGEWDAKLTQASNDKKVFEGDSASLCERAISAEVGGTAKSVAARFWGSVDAAGDAFHRTAGGGTLGISSSSADPACNFLDIDIHV